MTEPDPSAKIAGTWGEFLKHATGYGVTLDRLDSVAYADGRVKAVTFLRRQIDGQTLTYVMPESCQDNRPMVFGRLMNICHRLRIPEPKGWPIDF